MPAVMQGRCAELTNVMYGYTSRNMCMTSMNMLKWWILAKVSMKSLDVFCDTIQEMLSTKHLTIYSPRLPPSITV